jgi:transposase InsO family protein
MSNSDD